MPITKKSTTGYVRCISGFMLHDRTIVKGGQVLAANDRMVKGREHLFVPLEDDESIADATVHARDRKVNAAPRNRGKVVAAAASVTPDAEPAPENDDVA